MKISERLPGHEPALCKFGCCRNFLSVVKQGGFLEHWIVHTQRIFPANKTRHSQLLAINLSVTVELSRLVYHKSGGKESPKDLSWFNWVSENNKMNLLKLNIWASSWNLFLKTELSQKAFLLTNLASINEKFCSIWENESNNVFCLKSSSIIKFDLMCYSFHWKFWNEFFQMQFFKH